MVPLRHRAAAGQHRRVSGLQKSDLDIQVQDYPIRMAGIKTVDYPQKASLHRRARASGRFDCAFTVPVRTTEVDRADSPDRYCRSGDTETSFLMPAGKSASSGRRSMIMAVEADWCDGAEGVAKSR
jgi:hypothetical protein